MRLVVALVVGASVLVSGQAKFEPQGTASITGLVLTDDAQPRPLRRAIVTIEESASVIQPRVVTSDEDGRYVFRNLPPGRYRVLASRPPFVRNAYGAKRVAGPGSVLTGTMVVVGAGQVISNIDVVLPRGSVVTGFVRDIDGQPARGFRVNAHYFMRSQTGEKTLGFASSATTDDRGAYRMYGLRPGSYLVVVSSPNTLDATPQSDLEIARATDLIQRPGMASATAAAMPTPTPNAAPPRRPTVGYVPVFFPGVTDAMQALPVVLDVGEERTGVDISMQLVPTARLEVLVSFPDPKNKPRAQLRVTPAGLAVGGPVGLSTYSVSDETPTIVPALVPGTFTVTAGAVGADSPSLFATTEVRVSGGDQSLTLQLQPGVSVSGRIAFDASTIKPPADLTRVRVGLVPFQTTSVPVAPGLVSMVSATATGEFTINNVPPGRYRIEVTLPLPSHESGWYPKSMTLAGQEAFEGWAEIRSGAPVTGALLTMTDRPTEISGTMTDATGAPAPEFFIIVFSADQSHWVPRSRRIGQVRPASDGLFVFRNLPPGEYRLAAVTEIQEGEWFDPDFLSKLVDASIKLSLKEGAKIRQDIRIVR